MTSLHLIRANFSCRKEGGIRVEKRAYFEGVEAIGGLTLRHAVQESVDNIDNVDKA